MNSDEFWCRAFLAAMQGNYAQDDPGSDHARNARYCAAAADAAVGIAERRGRLDGAKAPSARPASDAVEFTAERVGDGDVWHLNSPHLGGGIQVHSEQLTYPLAGGVVTHIRWSESMPPEPIEVRLERKAGAW